MFWQGRAAARVPESVEKLVQDSDAHREFRTLVHLCGRYDHSPTQVATRAIVELAGTAGAVPASSNRFKRRLLELQLLGVLRFGNLRLLARF